MLKNTIYYPPIGISGAALVGKDTLCAALIGNFKKKYGLDAKRYSIAGDKVRKDLKGFLRKSLGYDVDMYDPEQKELLRPLMVEYGRYVRNQTNGRYFIDNMNKTKSFGKGIIPIIPDIRYAEYEKDELYWIKNEKKGILIFLERRGIKPANKFERDNNIIIKKEANFVFNIPNFKSETSYNLYVEGFIEDIVTTYQQDTLRP